MSIQALAAEWSILFTTKSLTFTPPQKKNSCDWKQCWWEQQEWTKKSKVVCQRTKTKSWKMLNCFVKLRGASESSDNPPCDPFHIHVVIQIIPNTNISLRAAFNFIFCNFGLGSVLSANLVQCTGFNQFEFVPTNQTDTKPVERKMTMLLIQTQHFLYLFQNKSPNILYRRQQMLRLEPRINNIWLYFGHMNSFIKQTAKTSPGLWVYF